MILKISTGINDTMFDKAVLPSQVPRLHGSSMVADNPVQFFSFIL